MSDAPKTWPGWTQGELQLHFIHTGVAEAIFCIFPDGTTMLDDCGDYPAITRWKYAVPAVPGPHRLAGDWVARYIQRAAPQATPRRNGRPLIDYMFLSHFHCDHAGTPDWQCIKDDGERLPGCFRSGFALAAEELTFDTAIARDWDERPTAFEDIHDHWRRICRALRDRDGLRTELFRLGATNQFALRRAPADYPDFRVTNICANGRILRRDGGVTDLYAKEALLGTPLNENGMSAGYLLQYGGFTFFNAGDFDSEPITGPDGQPLDIDDGFAAELSPVDVAKINHHGFRNMTERLVGALAARVWAVNVSNTREVSEDTLTRLASRAAYPGPRTIFPCVFADSRVAQAQGRDYLRDIAPETFGKGCHVVVTVPKGGDSYRVACLDASDEEMRVKGEYRFQTRPR